MAISDIKGTVSTTGIMNNRPVMPKGDVNPQLQAGGSQPLPEDTTKPVNPFAPKPTGPTLPNKEMAMGDNEEMTPIEQEIVNRANTLTDEDKEIFINILSPSVVGTLSKLLPEFADTMDELSSGEPNVIFPLSTIQRYAQSKYGGASPEEALQTFVSDVIKPDYDAFKQQLDNQTQHEILMCLVDEVSLGQGKTKPPMRDGFEDRVQISFVTENNVYELKDRKLDMKKVAVAAS